MAALTRRPSGPEAAAIARRLFAFADARGLTELYGRGVDTAAVQLGVKRPDAYLFPFLIYNDGGVEVGFHWMATVPYPPFHLREMRQELLRRLNGIARNRASARAHRQASELSDRSTSG